MEAHGIMSLSSLTLIEIVTTHHPRPQFLKSIGRKVKAEVKTTAHSARNRPLTTVVVPCGSHAMAQELLGGHGTVRTFNTRGQLRVLSPKEICKWLSVSSEVEAKVCSEVTGVTRITR